MRFYFRENFKYSVDTDLIEMTDLNVLKSE